jgi:hypothetical protein
MAASAPLAVPQFIVIATAALPSGFQVRMGTIFGVNVQPQALLVTGVRFNQDEIAVLGPAYRHEEHYVINCSLTTVEGDPDGLPDRMQEVYGLYNLVSVAVANNPTLNSTVRIAQCKQLEFIPSYDPKGFSVGQLDFEVACEQRVDALD